MKITVKNQRQMNFRETLDFCISSIRHRFSRSLLTLSVVILAVAFFMYLQCDNLFRGEIRKAVRAEVRENRAGSKLAALLFSPYSHAEFIRMIAECDDDLLQQLSRVFKWNEKDSQKFRRSAGTIAALENFFKELPPGKLQMFLKDGKGKTPLERFCSLTARNAVRQSRMSGIRLPIGSKETEIFIANFPDAAKALQNAENQWKNFQKKLYLYAGIHSSGNAVYAGRKWIIALSEKQQKELLAFLADKNFSPDSPRWQKMMEYLKNQDAKDRISAYLARPEIRQKWRKTFGAEKYTRLNEKLAVLDKEECRDFAGNLTDKERGAVANSTREQLKLNILQESFQVSENDLADEDHSRQIYLMTLAFFVCVIGIKNAMLISITERFFEIATLKCLGATDFFILIQIILESLIQGFTGGIAGVITGLIAASAANIISAGSRFADAWSFSGFSEAALYSIAAGIALSVISAIYPALKASRMAPMEAMRVQ